MKKNQCDVCNKLNDIGTDCCKKCGKNIRNKFDFNNVLFVISKIIKVISYFSFGVGINYLIMVPIYLVIVYIFNGLLNFNLNLTLNYIAASAIFLGLGIIFHYLSNLLKKYSLKLK